MSAGKLCDEGHNITLDAVQAVVRDKGGTELCKFHRIPGGLYVAYMKLRNPVVLSRQENRPATRPKDHMQLFQRRAVIVASQRVIRWE